MFHHRNVLFESAPVMPSFYLIHERKLQSSHEELMRIVAEEVPALVKGKTKVPLVTDEYVTALICIYCQFNASSAGTILSQQQKFGYEIIMQQVVKFLCM